HDEIGNLVCHEPRSPVQRTFLNRPFRFVCRRLLTYSFISLSSVNRGARQSEPTSRRFRCPDNTSRRAVNPMGGSNLPPSLLSEAIGQSPRAIAFSRLPIALSPFRTSFE